MITSLIFTRQIFLQTIFACKNTRTLNPITKIRNDTLLKRKRMIDRLPTILSVIEHTR